MVEHPSSDNPVRILNPHHGGARYTSFKRAKRFVSKGMAGWERGAIRFYRPSPEISRNVERELRHVPVINPMALLIRRTRKPPQ